MSVFSLGCACTQCSGFPSSACYVSQPSSVALAYAFISPACCFIYFYYFFFFFLLRALTFNGTPINDAHELHPHAETSCACRRCYFCKPFEGTASYGRIRVSCARSLIRKVCVYLNVWVFVHVRACARASFPAVMRAFVAVIGNEPAGALLAVHTVRRGVFTMVVLSLFFCLCDR